MDDVVWVFCCCKGRKFIWLDFLDNPHRGGYVQHPTLQSPLLNHPLMACLCRRKLVVHIQPGKPCAAASADASAVAQPVVQPPAKGQRKTAQGKGRRGKDSGAGAVGEARREVLSDLLAWRGEQDTYPEVVGPDPPAIKA